MKRNRIAIYNEKRKQVLYLYQLLTCCFSLQAQFIAYHCNKFTVCWLTSLYCEWYNQNKNLIHLHRHPMQLQLHVELPFLHEKMLFHNVLPRMDTLFRHSIYNFRGFQLP